VITETRQQPQPASSTPPPRRPPPPAGGSAPDSDPDSAPSHAEASRPDYLLHTDQLKKVYDGRAVVNGVDINVRRGEIVGLLGPNGAGKTTTFYMIVGLVPPNGGTVMFGGHDVTRDPMYQRARRGVGYLPQEESIFRKLTVRENIMAVMETLSLPRKEAVERCDTLMEQFGISHLAKNTALTLSGGEKRRLTIARSLVTRPSLLMLDEPFSGVDPIAVDEIQKIVVALRDAGLAILITDHNVRETLDIVDRAYLIFEGRVVRQGPSDFLINDPLSRELYLGERFSM
jgi:lipopolysaccharide export system ATP-binding protein